MMYRIFGIFSVCLILGIPTAFPEEDLDKIVDEVQKAYEKTGSLEARFTQEAEVKSLGKKQEASGSVYIKKPGKMRWNYLTPEKQFIISDGAKIWFYFPEDNQVMEEEVVDYFQSKSPMLFLTGKANLRELFTIQFEDRIKDDTLSEAYFLRLTPGKQEATYRKIVLAVRKSDFQIVGVSVEDLLGNLTRIRFQEMIVNTELDDSLFQFTRPEGVEVYGPSGQE